MFSNLKNSLKSLCNSIAIVESPQPFKVSQTLLRGSGEPVCPVVSRGLRVIGDRQLVAIKLVTIELVALCHRCAPISFSGCSSSPLTVFRNRAPSAPSTTRWSQLRLSGNTLPA